PGRWSSCSSFSSKSGGLRPAGPPYTRARGAPEIPAPRAWLTRCARSQAERRRMMSTRLVLPVALIAAVAALHSDASSGRSPEQATSPKYDLLLRGGHVIDAKNNLSAVRDVAIAGGKIAAVANSIDPSEALKTVDVKDLYVTPGLIDIHTHVYAGTGERRSYAGDNAVYPDGFTFRVGVTTVADAGGSGWRTFDDFKDRIIDRSKTRVLAFLNIVGNGM